MGKLFYGTQTGTTEGVAQAIQSAMPDLISECKNIYGVKPEDIESCDFLVLGGSTWGDGELTDDWADYLPQFERLNIAGKKVALFGLGDQYSYSYNFVSAMKTLYDKLKEMGAEVIGDSVPNENFSFDHSEALVGDKFVGLVVDEVNQPELSEERIGKWVGQLRLSLTGALA